MKHKIVAFLILVASQCSCSTSNISWDDQENWYVDGDAYSYDNNVSPQWFIEGDLNEVGHVYGFHGRTTLYKSDLDNNVNVITDHKGLMYFKNDFVLPDVLKTNIISITIGDHYSPDEIHDFEKKYIFKHHYEFVTLNDIMVPYLEDLIINSDNVSKSYHVDVIYENYEYLSYVALDFYVIDDLYYIKNVYTEDKYIVTEKYVSFFDI